MKTKTYVYVLQRATELTGRTYPPTPEEATIFRGFIATGLRQIWESYEWPETILTPKEYFGIVPDDATEYAAGTFLYWFITKKYYQVLSSVTTGNIPITDADGNSVEDGWYIEAKPTYPDAVTWDTVTSYDPGTIVYYAANGKYYAVKSSPSTAGYGPLSLLAEDWSEVFPFIRSVDKYLNKDGTTRTVEIGEVFRITREDPSATVNDIDVSHRFSGDLILTEEDIPYCFVENRTTPPDLATDPTTIPYRFSEYVAQFSASMMLAVDGKVDLAQLLMAQSERTLVSECDKIANQEGQFNRTSVGVR